MPTVYETIIFSGNVILLIGTLIVGSVLLSKALDRKMGNLLSLSFVYLLTSLSKIIQFAFGLQWANIAFLQTAIPLLIIEFTRRTFFKGRDDTKKMTYTFYAINTVTYLISATYAYRYTVSGFSDRSLYNIAAVFDIITVILPSVYTIIASREAIGLLDPTLVERYIYSRLKLWINLNILFMIGYAMWVIELIIPGPATYAILNSISTIIGLVHIFGSYLLWALPIWFKDYLNQGSQVDMSQEDEKETEEESKPTDTLRMLGVYLSQYLGTSQLSSRGHLRFAARKAFPNKKVESLNYRHWEKVLGEYLIEYIEKLNVGKDANEISEFMKNDLKRSQSVITMSLN